MLLGICSAKSDSGCTRAVGTTSTAGRQAVADGRRLDESEFQGHLPSLSPQTVTVTRFYGGEAEGETQFAEDSRSVSAGSSRNRAASVREGARRPSSSALPAVSLVTAWVVIASDKEALVRTMIGGVEKTGNWSDARATGKKSSRVGGRASRLALAPACQLFRPRRIKSLFLAINPGRFQQASKLQACLAIVILRRVRGQVKPRQGA